MCIRDSPKVPSSGPHHVTGWDFITGVWGAQHSACALVVCAWGSYWGGLGLPPSSGMESWGGYLRSGPREGRSRQLVLGGAWGLFALGLRVPWSGSSFLCSLGRPVVRTLSDSDSQLSSVTYPVAGTLVALIIDQLINPHGRLGRVGGRGAERVHGCWTTSWAGTPAVCPWPVLEGRASQPRALAQATRGRQCVGTV